MDVASSHLNTDYFDDDNLLLCCQHIISK